MAPEQLDPEIQLVTPHPRSCRFLNGFLCRQTLKSFADRGFMKLDLAPASLARRYL
jgi:hypothetical protein